MNYLKLFSVWLSGDLIRSHKILRTNKLNPAKNPAQNNKPRLIGVMGVFHPYIPQVKLNPKNQKKPSITLFLFSFGDLLLNRGKYTKYKLTQPKYPEQNIKTSPGILWGVNQPKIPMVKHNATQRTKTNLRVFLFFKFIVFGVSCSH